MDILVAHSHVIDKGHHDMAKYPNKIFIKIKWLVEVKVASKAHAKERGWMYYGCFAK